MARRYYSRRRSSDEFAWARLFSKLGWKWCLILAIGSFLVLHHFASLGIVGAGGAERFVSQAPSGGAPQDFVGALSQYLAGQVVVQAISWGAFLGQFLVSGGFLLGAVFAVKREWQDQNYGAFSNEGSEWTPAGLMLFGVGVLVLGSSGLVFALRDSLAGDALRGLPSTVLEAAKPFTAQSQAGAPAAATSPTQHRVPRLQPIRIFEGKGGLFLPPELLREFAEAPRAGVLKGVQRRCARGVAEIRVVAAVLTPGNRWASTPTFDPLGLPHQFANYTRNLALAGAVTAKWQEGDRTRVLSHWQTTVAHPSETPPAGMARGNEAAIRQAVPAVQEPCPSGLLPRQAIQQMFNELIELANRTPIGLLGSSPNAVRESGGRQYFFGARAAEAATAYMRLRRDLEDLGPAYLITQRQTNERTLEERVWYGANSTAISIRIALEDDGWWVSFRGPNGVQQPIML